MDKNYSKVLNHITDINLKQTIKKFIDSLYIVEQKNTTYITDFMNPNEMKYCISSINTFYNGEYKILPSEDNCERNCIFLYNKNSFFEEREDISYICANIQNEIITHRDVLGALLALGINRNKVGDIIILEEKIIIVLKTSLVNFVISNLIKIGQYKISFREIEKISFTSTNQNKELLNGIVSSLRIDSIISEILNISRGKAEKLIKTKKVKVNYEIITKTHIEVEENNLISVRGFGRFEFKKILGKTKKDKIRIEYEKFK